MADTYKVEDILDTYANSWGLGESHPDYPEYQEECRQIDTALDILNRAPSTWLTKNIKMLANEIPGHQLFFSEDGKTALIMNESNGNTLFVKLTKDEYTTGGGKVFWVGIGREEFGVANK